MFIMIIIRERAGTFIYIRQEFHPEGMLNRGRLPAARERCQPHQDVEQSPVAEGNDCTHIIVGCVRTRCRYISALDFAGSNDGSLCTVYVRR